MAFNRLKRPCVRVVQSWVLLGLIFTPASAHAVGDLHYSADTALTLGAFTVTIKEGSDATSLTVNNNATFTVIVPSGHDFTMTIPSGNSLNTSPTYLQSCGSPNQVRISGPATVVVTPVATQCTLPTSASNVSTNTQTQTQTQPSQTTTPKPVDPKPFTFEAPKETAVTAPETQKNVSVPTASTATLEVLKEEAKEIAFVPKKIALDVDETQVILEAQKAGISVDASRRGKQVKVANSKTNALVANFLTTDTETLSELSVKERVQVLAETQYLLGGKLKSETDITKALKVAEGIPLSDKELGKKALTDIKRNERAFCKPGVCAGFAVFDAILRGGEVKELSTQEQKKGVALFKKKTGRAPVLSNPLHQNLVEAFAIADLSTVKEAKKKK